MKQALHIFAKDARRFWPEILISLAITAAFVRIYPRQWAGTGFEFGLVSRLPVVVAVLLPVSWWVLIARVVHAESLVGERQFWITRPYRWQSLMAAKGLFLIVFLYMPFAVSQLLLLRAGGFHPLSYLPGLLFVLLMLTCIVLLPLVAIATVTRGFAKMSLALLILVLYVAGLVYLSTLLPSSDTPTDYGEQVSFALVFCVFLVVVVLQYSTRHTSLSLALLAILALTSGALTLAGPNDTPMNLTYRRLSPTDHAAAQIAFRGHPAGPPNRAIRPADNGREIEFSFPLDVSGVLSETAVKTDGAKVAISAPNGDHWTSHWQSESATWLPGQTRAIVGLKVSRAFYERVKSMPVTLDLSIATTELKAGAAVRIVVPRGEFSIPGGAICRANIFPYGDAESISDFACRNAFGHSPLMLVTTLYSKNECSPSQSPENDGDPALYWVGSPNADTAQFGITSVWTDSIYLPLAEYNGTETAARQYLCTGAILSFTPYTATERTQQHFVSPALHLGDYTAGSSANE